MEQKKGMQERWPARRPSFLHPLLLFHYPAVADSGTFVGLSVMRMPYFGRRVTRGWKTTGKLGTRSGVYRCKMVASSNFVSIWAKGMPMQMRGPAPNGK